MARTASAASGKPKISILKPWGTVQVDVVCYNDMPGNYGDYICSKVVGLEPVRFKAKTTVVGSPLTLANTCVGLDQTVSPPEYAFGDVLRSTGEAYRLLKPFACVAPNLFHNE